MVSWVQGGGLPILEGSRGPPFLTFSDIGGSLWSTPLCNKIGLSLSHLVPEIIDPKFGLFFQEIQSFDSFIAFCTHFTPPSLPLLNNILQGVPGFSSELDGAKKTSNNSYSTSFPAITL